MRQKVTAGKTTAGTKIQAKLAVATLVKGVVIPQDAILSGEVIESVAKSDSEPSRLSIRMESAQWKNGSVPINVYLTAWYYPILSPTARDLSDRQADPTPIRTPDLRRRFRVPETMPGSRLPHPNRPSPNTASL
jgi:hypothetical protein